MSSEEAEKKRSEEVVYQKIEEALLAMPEVFPTILCVCSPAAPIISAWLFAPSRAKPLLTEYPVRDGEPLADIFKEWL